MPNARVLPVPVRAWPIRSWPLSATGSVRDWMGNAVTMPWVSSATQIGSAMPRSRKVFSGTATGPAEAPDAGSAVISASSVSASSVSASSVSASCVSAREVTSGS
jgi:hypothetical protein